MLFHHAYGVSARGPAAHDRRDGLSGLVYFPRPGNICDHRRFHISSYERAMCGKYDALNAILLDLHLRQLTVDRVHVCFKKILARQNVCSLISKCLYYCYIVSIKTLPQNCLGNVTVALFRLGNHFSGLHIKCVPARI